MDGHQPICFVCPAGYRLSSVKTLRTCRPGVLPAGQRTQGSDIIIPSDLPRLVPLGRGHTGVCQGRSRSRRRTSHVCKRGCPCYLTLPWFLDRKIRPAHLWMGWLLYKAPGFCAWSERKWYPVSFLSPFVSLYLPQNRLPLTIK